MSHGPERHPADQLSAYLDGEMTRDEQNAIDIHLAACPACRAALQDYRALAAAAADEPAPTVPADLHARIRRRIEAARPAGAAATAVGPATGRSVPAAGRRFLPSYRLALAAAASALLVIGLWTLRPEGPEGPSSGPREEAAPFSDSIRPEQTESEAIRQAPPEITGAQPPATPSRTDREAADRLKALGYLDSGTFRPESGAGRDTVARPDLAARPGPVARPKPASPPASPAPSSTTIPSVPVGPPAARGERRDAAHEADSGLAKIMPSAEPPAPVEEARPIGDPHRDAAGAMAAGGAGAPPAGLLAGVASFVAPPVRWLEFDYADHRISVSETGALTIRSKQYACSIEPGAEGLDPSAVPELFAAADAALLGSRPTGAATERKSGPPSVRLTAAPEPADAPPTGSSPYPALPPPPAPRAAPTQAAPTRTAAPEAKAAPQPPPDIPAAAADDLDRRLRALLRERYLRLLEERCGPVPPPIRPD